MQTVELNAKIIGDRNNPPLIILHGLFGSLRNWIQLAEKFAEYYHVYVLDLRNHGDSPHAQAMDYPMMAADVTALMDAYGIPKATVLGHSMGGKVAMWLALSVPNRVQRLIVVDIAPEQYLHRFAEIFRGLLSIPLREINSRQQADNYLAVHIDEIPIRQFLLQNLVNRVGEYTWRIPLNDIEKAMPEIMGFPEINQVQPYIHSALFIGGARSEYLLPKHYQRIELLFPLNAIEMIENAGHWVHAEQPMKMLEIIEHYSRISS